MIKYTEDIEKMIISVENYNAFLTKMTGEMTLGGKVLNKIFDLLSRLFSGISDYFDSRLIIIDLVVFLGLPLILSGYVSESKLAIILLRAFGKPSKNKGILMDSRLLWNPIGFSLWECQQKQ